MKTKQLLQEAANTSKNSSELLVKAAGILKIENLNLNQLNYWIRKFEIKTGFRRGKPARKFD